MPSLVLFLLPIAHHSILRDSGMAERMRIMVRAGCTLESSALGVFYVYVLQHNNSPLGCANLLTGNQTDLYRSDGSQRVEVNI